MKSLCVPNACSVEYDNVMALEVIALAGGLETGRVRCAMVQKRSIKRKPISAITNLVVLAPRRLTGRFASIVGCRSNSLGLSIPQDLGTYEIAEGSCGMISLCYLRMGVRHVSTE